MQKDVQKEARTELVDRASDPFRVVRTFIYVTFGIAGTVGIGLAIFQGDMGNVAVNAAVLAAGVGVFFLDRSLTASLREKVRREPSAPP